MDIEQLKNKKFVNGELLCVMDATYENFRDLMYLHQYLLHLTQNDPMAKEEMYEEQINKNVLLALQRDFENILSNYPPSMPIYIYVYCFLGKMRIQFLPVLFNEEDIKQSFDMYLVETKKADNTEIFEFLEENSNLLPNLSRSMFQDIMENNALIVVPKSNLETSNLLKQYTGSKKVSHRDCKKEYLVARVIHNGYKLFEANDKEIDCLSLLFNGVFFIEPIKNCLH